MKMLNNLLLVVLILSGISACEKESLFIPDEYSKVAYYSDEIVPDDYREIYGRWRLVGVSGGFSGGGYEPDFEYIEFRKFGVYGIIENDSLIEYGRIEIDTFDNQNAHLLQIKFTADYHVRRNPYFYPGFYVEVNRNELNLNAYCCDFFNYHFKRLP